MPRITRILEIPGGPRTIVALGLLGTVAALVPFAGACSAPGSAAPATNLNKEDGGGAGTLAPASTPATLPFVVSQNFAPSGFMGDSPTDFNQIKLSSATTQCIARQPGAVGSCYTLSWTPTLLSGQKSAWVGVYWQYPTNNWGAMTGRPIAPGATKITFTAAGAAGGEQVEFIAGGVNTVGDAGLPNSDSFTANTTATLTTSWASYEIPLTGDMYTDVIGGFAWSITTSSTTPITFYIDNIEWE
jgi:hypothetical protein